MTPSRTGDVMSRLIATRWPAFVWGPPGIGKSAVVLDVASKLGRRVIDIRAALLDPTDIRGIPFVSEGTARWCAPSFLPQPGSGPGILFFDELSSAPPLVQASLYQLTLDRRAGEYHLPDDWSIVAAGNRVQDSSIAYRMPAALANRFVHLDFEVDFTDWRAWATAAAIAPTIVAFLSVRPALLFDMSADHRCFPSPRSWEMASDALARFERVTDAEDVMVGIVGEGATGEFFAFLRDSQISEVIKALMANPVSAPIPSRIDLKFALVSYLASELRRDDVLATACALLNRLGDEIGVVLLKDILRLRPKAIVRPEIRSFMDRNKKDFSL